VPGKVAAQEVDLQLQVGRFLRGRALATAVVAREMLIGLLFSGTSETYAPAWVRVASRATGRQLIKVPAGRELNAGPELLAAMESDANRMTTPAFLQKWGG